MKKAIYLTIALLIAITLAGCNVANVPDRTPYDNDNAPIIRDNRGNYYNGNNGAYYNNGGGYGQNGDSGANGYMGNTRGLNDNGDVGFNGYDYDNGYRRSVINKAQS